MPIEPTEPRLRVESIGDSTKVAALPAEQTTFQTVMSALRDSFSGGVKQFQKHQRTLRAMVGAAGTDAEYLAQQIPLTLKNVDTKDVLRMHHDLTARPVDEAVLTDSFKSLKAIIAPARIERLVYLGKTFNASRDGGISHSIAVLDQVLLDGAQKGIAKALQARVLTDADKQSFLADRAQSMKERLAEGTTTPEEIIEEVAKLQQDSVLGVDAQQGQVGRELSNITAAAEKQIVDTERSVVVEEIKGNFQANEEILDQIYELFEQLTVLKTHSDASVEESAEISMEAQEIANQIIALVKSIDDESEISAAHIINPVSKNITPAQEKELKALILHDTARATRVVKARILDANAGLVEKLNELQSKRSYVKTAWDNIFGSTELKALAENRALKNSIAALDRQISSHEAAIAAKVASATKRTWSEFLGLSSEKKSTPAETFMKAQEELEEFTADETVKDVLTAYHKLVAKHNSLAETKQNFWNRSRIKSESEKNADRLHALVSAHTEIFERYQELVRARNIAEQDFMETQTDADSEEEFVEV